MNICSASGKETGQMAKGIVVNWTTLIIFEYYFKRQNRNTS
jgi:hypothetical protein